MSKLDRQANLKNEFVEGRQAESVILNPSFRKAVEELERKYVSSIRRGNMLDKLAMKENCRRLQVLGELVTNLENKIVRGEQALKRLEANHGNKQR